MGAHDHLRNGLGGVFRFGGLGSWVPPLSAALPRPSMRLLYVVLSTASFPCLIITRGDGLRLETLLVTIRHQNDLDKQ